MHIVEVHFPPGARVAFETGARDARVHQQVWVLEGTIDVTVGDERHRLRDRRLPGDAARPPDDVPQPDAQAGALRGGDRVRAACADDAHTPWTSARLHALDDAQIDGSPTC